jgi:membrane protein
MITSQVLASKRSAWQRLRLLAEVLYHQVDRDRVFMQAAALTYKTLFSLLPVIVLSLLMLSTISSGAGRDSLVGSVKRMLFEQLNADKMQITDATGSQISLEKYVDQMIDTVQGDVNKKAVGASLVAFLVLLYGALTLMVVIEGTFNQICGAAKGRSWPRRIMLYWCVLTLGPIGVAVSLALGKSAFSAASSEVGAGWILSGVNIVTGFAISWLLILFMYRLSPEARVRWRPAALGSFLAAGAWEIGKWAFGLYVATAAKNSWYGSLALLPLFMLWIYITWSVVLIGLEITYVRQYWALLKRRYLFIRASRHNEVGGGHEEGLSDLRWVLALGVLLQRRFKEGRPLPIDEAAETLMVPNEVSRELLETLQRAGLLHVTAERAYVLARPPESITAYDLLAAARAACHVPPELAREMPEDKRYPESAGLKEYEKLETEWAKGKTLVDLAG